MLAAALTDSLPLALPGDGLPWPKWRLTSQHHTSAAASGNGAAAAAQNAHNSSASSISAPQQQRNGIATDGQRNSNGHAAVEQELQQHPMQGDLLLIQLFDWL